MRTVLIDASTLRTEHRVRGVGRYVRDLLLGLDETREQWTHELSILALHDLSSAAVSSELRAISDEALASPTIDRVKLAGQRRWGLQLAAKRAGASLVHETEVIGSAPLAIVPRLVTCYDLIPLRYPKHYLPRRGQAAIEHLRAWRRYRFARRVVAISPRTRDDVISMLGVPASRVEAVQTGIDLGLWASARQAMKESDVRSRFDLTGPFVLYVGGADYRKNLEGMFRAVRHVQQQAPIVLAWAGKLDEHTMGVARKLAAQEGVEDRVRFLGYVDDDTLACAYRAAVVQLFLSRLEGFGLPVAEAMACGCPSIVAACSGSDDLVGSAGLVVDADDAKAAAAAILGLLRDPSRRAELGAACLSLVKGMTRANMALGYVQAYHAALRTGP